MGRDDDDLDSHPEVVKTEPEWIVNNSVGNADQLRLLLDSNQSSSQNNGTNRDAVNEKDHTATNQVPNLEIVRTGADASVAEDDDYDYASDDDVEILGPETPLPIRTNVNGMIKREGDSISANVPFIVTVGR